MFNNLSQEIEEDNLINYYDKKHHALQILQYDLYFNAKKTYDPKVIKDCAKSQKEIYDNIYNEVCIWHKCSLTFIESDSDLLLFVLQN